jgi:hypothetical protein
VRTLVCLGYRQRFWLQAYALQAYAQLQDLLCGLIETENEYLARARFNSVCNALPRGVFFLVSWSAVRLSPLGTSATNWPIVPAPDAI